MNFFSLRDYCCLLDLITDCVQKSTSKPLLTNKLEEYLFDTAKINKENIKTKVFGEILDKVPSPLTKALKCL